MSYRLEWRPPGVERSPLFFLSASLPGRADAMALAARLSASEGRAAGFRIQAADARGGGSGDRVHADAASIAAWPSDEPLPAPVATDWSRDLEQAASRRLATAAIGGALRKAGSSGLLCREQVADILNVVEQAFDRVGVAARRLPV